VIGVYGWTRKPLVEYYIVESYGYLHPAAGAIRVGTTFCINRNISMRYEIYQITRPNQPSIDGTATFKQFWSVRVNIASRSGVPINGTMDTECHFKAWKELGMELGEEMVYQLFVTEGWYSGGKTSFTVS
jgi:endo-1,4-beta-xylanase